MPIIELDGDIFESGADILVNPVNCVGVMGKGLALQFKRRFPEDFRAYKIACDEGNMRPGHGLLSRQHGKSIYHFPTKRHWRERSDIEFVNLGLKHLKSLASMFGCRSMAMPAVGCGLGGLAWVDVKRDIHAWFDDWPADVFVYPPK